MRRASGGVGVPKVRCDLHIHTALSPCAAPEMTPKNIVNMATLAGANVIAITDHNSVRNVWAVTAAAGSKLVVVPAMEVWTREDVHMLCLFPNLMVAETFDRKVYAALPNRRGDEDLFGQQYLFDSENKIIGWEERLLLSPVELSIDDVCNEVTVLGGVVIPAHVDRTYSVITQLGFIPPHLPIGLVEVSRRGKQPEESRAYQRITNSDAHSLAALAGSIPWELDVPVTTAEGVIEALKLKIKPQ